jgi:hypothetical protein
LTVTSGPASIIRRQLYIAEWWIVLKKAGLAISPPCLANYVTKLPVN